MDEGSLLHNEKTNCQRTYVSCFEGVGDDIQFAKILGPITLDSAGCIGIGVAMAGLACLLKASLAAEMMKDQQQGRQLARELQCVVISVVGVLLCIPNDIKNQCLCSLEDFAMKASSHLVTLSGSSCVNSQTYQLNATTSVSSVEYPREEMALTQELRSSIHTIATWQIDNVVAIGMEVEMALYGLSESVDHVSSEFRLKFPVLTVIKDWSDSILWRVFETQFSNATAQQPRTA